METIQSINLIAINPKVRSGRPYIAGTTLEVAVIAIAKIVHVRSPEEIAANYGVSLAQVYAALAYYYDQKAEMDEQIRSLIRRAEELKEKRIGSRHKPLFG